MSWRYVPLYQFAARGNANACLQCQAVPHRLVNKVQEKVECVYFRLCNRWSAVTKHYAIMSHRSATGWSTKIWVALQLKRLTVLCLWVCVCVGFVMCECFGICVLVFTVFCIVCTVFLYCYLYVYLFYLYWCKDCCYRVTTQLQLVNK